MNKPIAVGDLVVVVGKRPCCPPGKALGRVFTVSAFYPKWACLACKREYVEVSAIVEGFWSAYPLQMLKRIPPLSELESERTEEKTKEPA